MLLGEPEFVNELDRPLQQVALTICSDPPFLRPKTGRIDSEDLRLELATLAEELVCGLSERRPERLPRQAAG